MVSCVLTCLMLLKKKNWSALLKLQILLTLLINILASDRLVKAATAHSGIVCS